MVLNLLVVPDSDSNYTQILKNWRAKFLILYYNGLNNSGSRPTRLPLITGLTLFGQSPLSWDSVLRLYITCFISKMISSTKNSIAASGYLRLFNDRFKFFSGLQKSDSLAKRKKLYEDFFKLEYFNFRKRVAEITLASDNANKIVRDHTAWMDGWITFTWQFVFEEEEALMGELLKEGDKKLLFLKSSIPEKKKRHRELADFLSENADNPVYMDAAERAYYKNSLKDIGRELNENEMELETLNEIIPLILSTRPNEEKILGGVVIFARGGYGRSELTFTSDVDLGYCLDLESLTKLQSQTVRELIKRMEDLFQCLELDIASQYLELNEDFSRFRQTAALHTVPSILESRTIIGNQDILDVLKNQILSICPQEKMIRYLKRQLDKLKPVSNEVFYIKEGYGGVRHIQYAMWMVLIVVDHESGNSADIFDFLKRNDWISNLDEKRLNQALELYFDLRNFIGLYEFFGDKLREIGFESLTIRHSEESNYLDDQSSMAYLKLRNRFTTVDFLDRFRLHSIQTVARLAQSIVGNILDRTISEKLPGFVLFKHLGTNQITHFQPLSSGSVSTDSSQTDSGVNGLTSSSKGPLEDFFLFLPNLMELFKYIGKTGNQLSPSLTETLSSLIPDLYDLIKLEGSKAIRDFIFDLFITENSSTAIRQMIEIASPLSRKGNIKTLLGLFLPEVNQMRFLLRNTEIHEYPLCIHSMKALQQVEDEIDGIQKNEPELWRFVSEEDIFALKWSMLFHDLGKINPYRNHEELGPVLSTQMLLRLGWAEDSETLDLIRLLVANHQSIVRFSQLSTYLDLGILKFFELAQRDPGKVLLLYLINISDFKSVNSEMRYKTAHLEKFFEKTINILSEFKREHLSGSMNEIINNYLNRMVSEVRISVLLELLLRQCCNMSLEDVILTPLRKISYHAERGVEEYRKELDNALEYLKLAELDHNTLNKYRFRFIQIIKQAIPEKVIFELVKPLSSQWSWFFTTVPNRYLLSSEVGNITTQLQQFESREHRNVGFSFNKGEPGEYDTVLFYSIGDLNIQAKIAYALSRRGVNIENGKINKVIYADQQEGWVGFFNVSQQSGEDALSNIELESVIENLIIPPLYPPPVSKLVESHIQVHYFHEPEKGYQICETNAGHFSRIKTNFVAVKISLFDAPFCYYKIIRSFEAIGIIPQQVTITTIGNQIIDYFYIHPDEKEKLVKDGFKSLLQKYVNAKIYV
jgi:UTP:GlnB (protein PII) uridylyltransferase